MTQTIVQGVTTSIEASNVRIDGVLTNMTGWTVHAVLRRDHVGGAVVAEWHTTPTGSQGQATVGNGVAELLITPAMSTAWTWSRGVVHAEATEPTGSPPRKARIIDDDVYLDPEAVI